jgi:hypothetical protein
MLGLGIALPVTSKNDMGTVSTILMAACGFVFLTGW